MTDNGTTRRAFSVHELGFSFGFPLTHRVPNADEQLHRAPNFLRPWTRGPDLEPNVSFRPLKICNKGRPTLSSMNYENFPMPPEDLPEVSECDKRWILRTFPPR